MPVLYSLPEAAKALGGISVWTLRKHVTQGRVRVTRIGRRIFLDAEELDRIRREGLPSLRAGQPIVPCPRDVSTSVAEENIGD